MIIKSIQIYPIKSLAGIEIQAAQLEERGFEHDRRWVLVDVDGTFQSQRELPQMALFKVAINNDSLLVTAPNGSRVIILFVSVGVKKKVVIWDDSVEGLEVSSEVSNWFSEQLSKEVFLIKMTKETNRLIDVRYALKKETVSFADGYPLLLTNTASLDNLNKKLTTPISMDRFRPNLVFEGDLAFEEDNWSQLTIGTTIINVVKRCARCVIVNINPKTATKELEVLQALATYRRTGNKVHFGVNALIIKNGLIKVGDHVSMV